MALTLRDELPGEVVFPSRPDPQGRTCPVVLRHHEDRDLLPPIWPTKTRAKLEVEAWIETPNRYRPHSSIGQISPVAFKVQQCNQSDKSKGRTAPC